MTEICKVCEAAGEILAKLIVHCTQEAIFSPPAQTIRLFSASICPCAVKNTVEERYELLNIAHVWIWERVRLHSHICRHFTL